MKIEISGPRSDAETTFGYAGIGLHIGDKEYWIQTLPKTEWYFGPREIWYDGPIKMFGCGVFEFIWHFHL
jgi:hypothetical protein